MAGQKAIARGSDRDARIQEKLPIPPLIEDHRRGKYAVYPVFCFIKGKPYPDYRDCLFESWDMMQAQEEAIRLRHLWQACMVVEQL